MISLCRMTCALAERLRRMAQIARKSTKKKFAAFCGKFFCLGEEKLRKKIFKTKNAVYIKRKNTYRMYGTFRHDWEKPGKSTKKSELFAQKSFGRNDERIPTLFQLMPKKV